jgi:hypothetical protein
MAFPVEEIPDDANLFNRIHRNHFPGGKVSSVAFDQERLSVNCEKYRSAEDTADTNSAAVVALAAGECRKLEQTVEHAPIEPEEPSGPNQAHSEICGNKSKSIRRKLRDSAKLVWQK